ncbi:ABC transporter permease [Bogoriella caseilytica]|uniref:Transport permease protein n=1 Tax=Bogoriella caseilytica TaxID=56055 RepID=A0A3N2BA32_9MICO|nr:ABC transporter permease [Bogoriella caseilytica]ROR72111.1 teichoic acid transport system permease protein [Bogoriella caseilytica]
MGATPTSGADTHSRELEALAREHGLNPIGVRPRLWHYISEMWRFRHFVYYMATARAYAENQRNYLGQMWAVLTPTLTAAVYVAVFGLVLGADRGLENGVAFIVVGVFLFRFFQTSVTSGAHVLAERLTLVRSLRFPRAALPISAVITELANLVPALVAMCLLVPLTGLIPGFDPVPITWWWLLLPVAVLIFALINTGVALIAARIVAATPDFMQIIHFLMRFAIYGSGVLFPVTHYVEDWDLPWLVAILEYQPIALGLDLSRQIILDEPTIPIDPLKWLIALGFGIALVVVGFIYFWGAEERYGRD